MHYEVELHELTYANDGNSIPTPLTFDALCAAQAYVGRNQPGAVRIVRVTDDGEREVVEAGGA